MKEQKTAGAVRSLSPAILPEVEQELLSHVELCYTVALALTHDPVLGRRLARATLLWAWHRQTHNGGPGRESIKKELLRDLLSRFLEYNRARSAGNVVKSGPMKRGYHSTGLDHSREAPEKAV